MSSTTYIKRPPNVTATEDCLAYTKEILGGRLFSGSYLERRYVAALGQYRDVVVIHSEETELCRDLDKVVGKWMQVPDVKWTGITCPGSPNLSAYRLWVKLSNLPMDSYWFQIKHIRMVENELSFQLKCLRKAPTVTKSTCQLASTQNEVSTSGDSSLDAYEIINRNVKDYLEIIQGGIKEGHAVIWEKLTWKNVLEAGKTTLAAVILFFCGMIFCLKSVAWYILVLIRELSNLVHAFTPIIIHLIDLCSKIIGGMFILLAGTLGFNRQNRGLSEMTRSPKVIYAPLPPASVNWKERNRLLKQELFEASGRQ